MGEQLLFQGDRAECAKWLPLARKEVKSLRRIIGANGGPLHRKIKLGGGASITLDVTSRLAHIKITGGYLGYEWYAAPDDDTDYFFRAKVRNSSVNGYLRDNPKILRSDYPDGYINVWYGNSSCVTGCVGPRYGTGGLTEGGVKPVELKPRVISSAGYVEGPDGSECTGAAIQGAYCVGIDRAGLVTAWLQTDPTVNATAQITMPSWAATEDDSGNPVGAYWVANSTGDYWTATATDANTGVPAIGYIQAIVTVAASSDDDLTPTIDIEEGNAGLIAGLIGMDYAWESQPESLEAGQQDIRYAYISGVGTDDGHGGKDEVTYYLNIVSATDGVLETFPVQTNITGADSGLLAWSSKLIALDLRCRGYLVWRRTGHSTNLAEENRQQHQIYATAFGDEISVESTNWIDPNEYTGDSLAAISLGAWVSEHLQKNHYDCLPTQPDDTNRPFACYQYHDRGDESLELDAIVVRGASLKTHAEIYAQSDLTELPASPAQDQGAMVVGMFMGAVT